MNGALLTRPRVLIPALFGALLTLAACAQAGPDEVVAAATDDQSYAVVYGWPSLPAGYRMGQAAGLAVNSRNEVVLFHRADQSWLREDGMITRPTIMVLDGATGEVVREIGAGLFRNAHGTAVDSEDNIWVTDNNLHQVFKLSPEGEVLLVVGEEGVRGEDETHFNGVTDVAVAPDGSFYVSDGYGNNRVAKFDAQGNFLFDWGGERGTGPGQFDLPHGITLDDEGNVYVADRTNSRIQKFDAEGNFLAEWTQWQSADLGRPWGLEYHDGSIFVADGGEYWLVSQFRTERPDTLPLDRAQIQRLDMQGNVVEAWGEYGRHDGQMVWPHDVTVDGDGNVYSAEVHQGMRIQKWARGGGSVGR